MKEAKENKVAGVTMIRRVIISILIALSIINIVLIGYHFWRGSQSARFVTSFEVTPYVLLVLAIQFINIIVLIRSYKQTDGKKALLELIIFIILTVIACCIPSIKETYYAIDKAAEGQAASSKYVYYYENIYGGILKSWEEKGADVTIVNK